MRGMRGVTLAGVAMLAGCLESKIVRCDNGVICPAGTSCALAPVYCESETRVEACAGVADFARCTLPNDVVGACRGGACFECVDNELAGCAHTGWFPMVSNTPVKLRGVWTAGPGVAYAVGGDTIVRYNGFAWRPEVIPGVLDFTAVWGSDPDHVFAATGDGDIYQRTHDGPWERVHDGSASLVSIGGSGPDDVVALGPRGIIVRSAGASWAPEMIPTTELLYGLAVQSRADVFVAGTNGVIFRSMGATWSPSRPAMTGQKVLNAIAATPTSVFAIGDSDATTTALRLPAGASTWIADDVLGVPDGSIFTGIWASAENEAFAVGRSGLILRYAGTWAVVASTGADLYAIHGSDRSNVFAVGVGGTILRYIGQ